MLQLERTIGIRMERMRADGASEKRLSKRSEIDMPLTVPGSKMFRLPGEVLQRHREKLAAN
jgi:hypothetical protein